MSATKDYFAQQIAEAVNKALSVPVADVQIEADGVVITVSTADTDAPFWLAVKEQADGE